MRVVALITGLIALLATTPLTAQIQDPSLSLGGSGHFGTNISIEMSNAVPGAEAIMLVGFTQGSYRIGNLVTLGIVTPVMDAMGQVPQNGMLTKQYSVPELPAVVTGTPLYFQGVTLEPTSQAMGQVRVRLTPVRAMILQHPESANSDG